MHAPSSGGHNTLTTEYKYSLALVLVVHSL
jgi:hypothetical protein